MDYTIAIPSHNRSHTLNEKTLKTLRNLGIDKNKINIFVALEEKEEYRRTLNKELYGKIYNGTLGNINQRRLIEQYYKKGKKIVFINDDIDEIDLSLTEFKNLNDFIIHAFSKCIEEHSFIWGVYPVYNKFYRQTKKDVTTDLRLIVGCFYGIINRPDKEEIQVQFTDNKDDTERTLRYFTEDQIVLRFNKIGVKTNYYKGAGGMGLLKDRLPHIKQDTLNLEQHFSTYGKIKERKNGIYEFVLNKMPSPLYNIMLLKPCEPGLFDNLKNMLDKIQVPYVRNENRHNFPRHQAMCFGLVRARCSGIIGVSKFSVLYPEIAEEIERIGILLCPFNFTSAYLLKNVVCPKHKDANNVGTSLLCSFGTYEGCDIIINGASYDARKNGIVFNGSQLEHYNTPLISGDKYSLVFYNRNDK